MYSMYRKLEGNDILLLAKLCELVGYMRSVAIE